jgi:hypothetical protein
VHRWPQVGRALIVARPRNDEGRRGEGRSDLGVHIAGPWATELIARATSPSTGRPPRPMWAC